MKIIYLSVLESYDEASGVQKKINHQVKALHKLKVNIDAYIIVKDGHNVKLKNNDISTISVQYVPINVKTAIKSLIRKIPLIGKFYIEKKCYEKMHDVVNQHEDVDIIYLRNMRGSPYLLRFAKNYCSKIIIEHQSKELDEFKSAGLVLRYLLEFFYKPLVHKYIRGCVCVTEEIEAYQKKRFKGKSLNTKVITNSFEVASVKARIAPDYDNHSVRLLFIGNISYWHGLDRTINGLINYRGDKNVELYIIGAGEYKQSLKDLVRKLDLKESVLFIEPKMSDELDLFFDHCHVAVGSLGIHRINMLIASTLKVREYLSRGMPFILSYKDTDLNDPEIKPFTLKVPSDDSPIDIEEVIKFVEKVYNLEDHPNKIRNYALRTIDSAIKAEELKKYIMQNADLK